MRVHVSIWNSYPAPNGRIMNRPMWRYEWHTHRDFLELPRLHLQKVMFGERRDW